VGPADAEIGEELGDTLEVIEVPRSAWMVSVPLVTPWAVTAWVMNSSASSAVSVVATIQPTM